MQCAFTGCAGCALSDAPRRVLASTWHQPAGPCTCPDLERVLDERREACPRRGHRITCSEGAVFPVCWGSTAWPLAPAEKGGPLSQVGFKQTPHGLCGRFIGLSGAGVVLRSCARWSHRALR